MSSFFDLPPQNYVFFLLIAALVRWLRRPRLVDVALLIIFGVALALSVYKLLPRPIDQVSADGNYNLMIGQVLAGKLSLPVEPDPKLLALSNPHHPFERAGIPFRIDFSLYKGKYYLYPGLVPTLLLGLPYYLVTGRYLSEATYYFVFALFVLLFGYLLTLRLIERFAERPATVGDRYFVAGIFGLSCLLGSMSQRLLIVEISAVAGLAFVLSGLWCAERGRETRRFLYWSGILMGLGVGSRALSIFSLLAFLGICSERRHWKPFLVGFLPVLGAIGVYNFLRYGRPWEFGYRYVLNHVDFLKYYSLKNEIYGVLTMLFQPSFERVDFPYVMTKYFGEGWLAFNHTWLNEPTVGLFFLFPFVLLVLPRMGFWFRSRRYWPLAGLVLTSVLVLLADASSGTSLRYTTEFSVLLVVATLAWMRSRPRPGLVYTMVAGGLFIYSMNLGFFMTFTNHPEELTTYNPSLREKLSNFYKPLLRDVK